jgi:hypothetical protein
MGYLIIAIFTLILLYFVISHILLGYEEYKLYEEIEDLKKIRNNIIKIRNKNDQI